MGDISHADNEVGKVSKEFGGSFPRLFPDVRKPTNQAGDRLTKKLSGNAPQTEQRKCNVPSVSRLLIMHNVKSAGDGGDLCFFVF